MTSAVNIVVSALIIVNKVLFRQDSCAFLHPRGITYDPCDVYMTGHDYRVEDYDSVRFCLYCDNLIHPFMYDGRVTVLVRGHASSLWRQVHKVFRFDV